MDIGCHRTPLMIEEPEAPTPKTWASPPLVVKMGLSSGSPGPTYSPVYLGPF